MVRNIVRSNPLETKGRKPKDKFYKEVVKQSLPTKEYWESPPRDYKGTRLQWSLSKSIDAKIKKMIEQGKVEDAKKFRVENDYNRDINTLETPLKPYAIN